MKANFPLMPNATLGLMGGGQLGRMMALPKFVIKVLQYQHKS